MASVINANANQIKLNNGQTTVAQNGGWYDGQQYWNGSLGGAGVGNNPNQTDIYGKAAPTQNAADAAFIAKQQASPSGQPSGTPAPAQAGNAGTGAVSPSTSTGSGADIAGLMGTNAPTLNLPDLYNTLSDKAGISKMESDLTTKETAYNDAMSKINDNPYLSEGDRTGRGEKLTTDYNNDIKTTQDAMTMAKQDVQTQLDLQTKQFDINSQQATQALSEFNTLLSSGALDGATGNDIAAITKATGISSGMVQAAITAQTAKDTPTSLTTVDDGTNQYAVLINTKTGAVISKQVLAASKPVASTATDTKQAELNAAVQDAQAAAKNGKTLDWMMANYPSLGISKEQIFAIYMNQNYYHNTPNQIADAEAQYGL